MTSSIVPSPFGTFSLPFPWATVPVDALICALDARNVGIPEIVRRVKKQFPALAPSAIPMQAVERRILILDQIVEIDYFKHGLGLGSKSIEHGVGATKAVKHGLAIHANAGEAWERTGLTTSKSKASTESLRGPILGLERLTVKASTDSLKEPGRGEWTPFRISYAELRRILTNAIHPNAFQRYVNAPVVHMSVLVVA